MPCFFKTGGFRDRKSRLANAFCQLIAGILMTSVFAVACALQPKPVAVDPARWQTVTAPRERKAVLARLESVNDGLSLFKGKGKLIVNKNGRRHIAERLYWISAMPDRIRLAVVASSGLPIASFASDGKWFYLLSHTEGYFSKKPLASANLETVISAPVSVIDINFLLLGRLPIIAGNAPQIYQHKSDQLQLIVFRDDRDSSAIRVTFDPLTSTVMEFERIDRWGNMLYEVVFGSYQAIGPYRVPFDISVNSGKEYDAKLTVFEFWPNTPAKASAFTLHDASK